MTLPAVAGATFSRPLKVDSAIENGIRVWKRDMKDLFENVKDRYPDIVWKVRDDLDGTQLLEAWGHKAMIYARATPGFHLRHLSEMITPSPSKDPHVTSKNGHIMSPVPRSLIRRATPYRNTLFYQELEEIYTGECDGVSQSLYLDFSLAQDRDWRTKQLREDLVFMWRTRLYSDVQIRIPRTRQSNTDPVVFHAHRFILLSRSPYFANVLSKTSDDENINHPTPVNPLSITLHSPPFTAHSFDFILEFIYNGTLNFMDDDFKINTALSIWRGSLYFNLPSLQKLICSHITQNMLHGLCYSALDTEQYHRIVGNKWTTMVKLGGCQCQQCKIWAPRLLEFSMDPGIKNDELERGSLRALIRSFGPGWCTIQFASLPQSLLDYVLLVVRMSIVTPRNALCLLFAAEEALSEIQYSHRPWLTTVKSAIMAVRGWVDTMLCEETEECLECEAWEKIRQDDALAVISNVRMTENTGKLDVVRDAIFRAVGDSDSAARKVYEIIDYYANLPAKSRLWIGPYAPVNSVLQLHLYQIKVGLRSRIQNVSLSPGFGQIPEQEETTKQEPEDDTKFNHDKIKTLSVYSHISAITRPMSVIELQETAQHPDIEALDLANVSLYSRASSRTASTDYGLFYTRRAYSQESLDTMTVRRSRAWSSLSNRDEVRYSMQSEVSL